LDALLEDLKGRLDAIDMHIHDVDRRETEETARTLEELQHRHISDTLRQASLRSASIPGVGPSMKMRLWTLGVWAAADVSSDRIRSMQHLKHDQLMEVVAWRVATETGARRTMPRQLPRDRKQTLHQRYARERVDLVGERSDAQASTDHAMQAIRESFGRRRGKVEERLRVRLEDRAELIAQLDVQLTLTDERRSRHEDDRRAVRQDMARGESVSFRRFVQTVATPWTRGDYT
jgi:DNA-binding helix-hairpin-helix protein with protein kinase domain